MRINGWSKIEAQRYIGDEMATWQKRSQIEWEIDLSLLREEPYKTWLEGWLKESDAEALDKKP